MSFTRIDSGTVHYRLEGPADAPTVVFINSLGSSLVLWDAVVAALPNIRALRYDLRGHGLSDAPPPPYSMEDLARDLLQLMDALGIDRAYLCGISIGGMIAQQTALLAPERVQGLVLCNTGMKLGDADAWNERAERVLADGLDAFVEPALERWFTPEFRDDPIVAGAANMLARTTRAGYAGCCNALGAADLRAEASKITAPALALTGELDMGTPPELGRALGDALPNGRFEPLPAVAHLACMERPADIAIALTKFLNES